MLGKAHFKTATSVMSDLLFKKIVDQYELFLTTEQTE